MRIITRKRIIEFYSRHPDARTPLEGWHSIVKSEAWASLQDARAAFPNADAVKVASGRTVTVFNIGGGKYRLLAAMHYNRNVAFVLAIMTHAEYDRGQWKEKF